MAFLDYHSSLMFDLLIKICHRIYHTLFILSRSLNGSLLHKNLILPLEQCNEALLNLASAYFSDSIFPTPLKAYYIMAMPNYKNGLQILINYHKPMTILSLSIYYLPNSQNNSLSQVILHYRLENRRL